MSYSAGIVFIHGAGLGSWIWNDTEKYIQTESFAIDYPGRNNGSGSNQKITLDDYCNYALNSIQNWNKEKLILAAHSIGGVVALKLAEKLGDRVIGFAGISAAIPRNGGSFVSALPFPKRIVMSAILRLAGTKPPKSAILKSLCSDLTPDQSEWVVNKFVPESTHLYLDKSNAPIPNVNRLYIKCTKDYEFSESFQDDMIKNLDTQQVNTLDSGHLPMISCPKNLADMLNHFAVTCENSA